VAEKVYPKPGGKPVSDFLKEALDAGVKLTVCTASMELHDLEPSDLIEGVTLAGGASMWEAAEAAKTTLSF
jgi:predicted peroxiredoxin